MPYPACIAPHCSMPCSHLSSLFHALPSSLLSVPRSVPICKLCSMHCSPLPDNCLLHWSLPNVLSSKLPALLSAPCISLIPCLLCHLCTADRDHKTPDTGLYTDCAGPSSCTLYSMYSLPSTAGATVLSSLQPGTKSN